MNWPHRLRDEVSASPLRSDCGRRDTLAQRDRVRRPAGDPVDAPEGRVAHPAPTQAPAAG